MITPAFEQFNRTQQLEEQALASGARQGGITYVDNSTQSIDNSSNSPIAASFPEGTSNLDAVAREAVARSND